MPTYIKFKFLYGTRTQRVRQRTEKPITAPANAKAFMFFDLDKELPAHQANDVPIKEMQNPSEWQELHREVVLSSP